MNHEVADILIVGGGPAGLTLSIMAAQMGLSSGVIESGTYPRVAHGDTLPAGIQDYFAMAGIDRERLYRDAIPFRALCVRWDKGTEIHSTGSPEDDVPHEGLHIPRHLLEPILVERATQLGVPILQPCVVRKLIMKGNRKRGFRVSGVSTDRGEFYGKFVVDAAGSRHWLARKLGSAIDYYSPPLYGYYNWGRGSCPIADEKPLIYSHPGGWSWFSRVQQPDLYQCTGMTFESLGPKGRSWMPDELRQAGVRPIGPTRRADMTWRVVPEPAGRGYFMIGDAVRRNDPMTNRGFELAMADACRVALLLRRWRDGEIDDEALSRQYMEDTLSQYLKGLEISRDFMRRHPQAPPWLLQEEPYYRREVPKRAAVTA